MKKNVVSALLGASVSVGIFALAYFLADPSYIDKFLPGNITESIIYFPMLVIAPISAIAIHESGHLLAGILSGQRVKLFVVAFLGLVDNNGKVKLFFNKNLAYFGGITAVVPKRIDDIDYRVFAKILIAGPISSLAYGIICMIAFLRFNTYLNSFFALTALTSFGVFLATTLPDKSGMMYTDRKRYQRLHKKGVTQDAEIAMYQLITQSIIENSFKNIDISKTSIVEQDDEAEMKFWAEYIRHQYYSENSLENERLASKDKLAGFKSVIGANSWKALKIE